MNGFGLCSRCGRAALEHLRTHSHCWECNYSPDTDPGLALWYSLEFRRPKRRHSPHDAPCMNWLSSRQLVGIGYGGVV